MDVSALHCYGSFESVIDDARQGDLETLFDFCGKDKCYDNDDYDMPYMGNANFKSAIPEVKKVIKKLQKQGL